MTPKNITLSVVATTIIAAGGVLGSLSTIKTWIPYAYADDVANQIEQVNSKVDRNTEGLEIVSQTAENIRLELKLERLGRKVRELEKKPQLTDFETESLKELKKQVSKIETDLE